MRIFYGIADPKILRTFPKKGVLEVQITNSTAFPRPFLSERPRS